MPWPISFPSGRSTDSTSSVRTILFGHDLAEAFKKGLKKYKPNAEIVGEAYHPLWTKDFAPYLTKIKGSGAEVIFTGDYCRMRATLLKQARELGIKLPFANLFMDDPNSLSAVGPAGTVGLLNMDQCSLNDGDIRSIRPVFLDGTTNGRDGRSPITRPCTSGRRRQRGAPFPCIGSWMSSSGPGAPIRRRL